MPGELEASASEDGILSGIRASVAIPFPRTSKNSLQTPWPALYPAATNAVNSSGRSAAAMLPTIGRNSAGSALVSRRKSLFNSSFFRLVSFYRVSGSSSWMGTYMKFIDPRWRSRQHVFFCQDFW